MRFVERKMICRQGLEKHFSLRQAAKVLAVIFERQKTKKKH